MSIEDDQAMGQKQGESPDQLGEKPEAHAGSQRNLQEIPGLAIKIITNPVGFFQEMPKSGGLIDPLIFMVILSVVASVLRIVLATLGLGIGGAMVGGLAAIIVVPIIVVIFGFIGAAIAYVIWKIMGSQENYETAFRCVAYTAAIAPVIALLNSIPYIGLLVSSLWPMALLAIASIHVHRRSVQVSWVVFGIIGILFALINVSGERTSRQLVSGMEEWQDLIEEQRQ